MKLFLQLKVGLNNFKYIKIFLVFLFNFKKLKSLDDDSLKKKIVLILNVFSHMKPIQILMA